jgi:hypothetical protein
MYFLTIIQNIPYEAITPLKLAFIAVYYLFLPQAFNHE